MQQGQLIGILGLVAVAACWALAIVLFRAGAAGSVARRLTFLLMIEGFVLITAGFPEFATGLPITYWETLYESHPALFWLAVLVHHVGTGPA